MIIARNAELVVLKRQALKTAVNTKYKIEIDKLELPPKGTLDTLIAAEIKERNARYKKEFKPLETRYQQSQTYKTNLDVLDENALSLEEKEINDLLEKFEILKTNIITKLDSMTDAYMATLKFITPITTVAVAPPTQTINVVANAPQPLVASKPQKIYKTEDSFKNMFKTTVADYIAYPGNYRIFKESKRPSYDN